jgi:hypothetical protein
MRWRKRRDYPAGRNGRRKQDFHCHSASSACDRFSVKKPIRQEQMPDSRSTAQWKKIAIQAFKKRIRNMFIYFQVY